MFFEMCSPRDQATPFAYTFILSLQTSYINGIVDHREEGCQNTQTDADANPTNYMYQFSFILVKLVACLYTLSTWLNMT